MVVSLNIHLYVGQVSSGVETSLEMRSGENLSFKNTTQSSKRKSIQSSVTNVPKSLLTTWLWSGPGVLCALALCFVHVTRHTHRSTQLSEASL